MMKLALGTVQFGLDYGISNKQGQVDKNQVADIVELAMSLGIDTLDCAGVYGNSEQVLGELFQQHRLKHPVNIISKIPALRHEEVAINDYFNHSLKQLKLDKIEALLFHHADNLIDHPRKDHLFQQLQTLKTQKKVNRIGVSVYSPEQLMTIARQYPIDIAQVPMNVFDQRFSSNEVLRFCQQKNIKLHVRSLFLQGLLLLEASELPNYFLPYQDKLRDFTDLAKHLGCSKLALGLALVAQELPVHKRGTSTESNVVERSFPESGVASSVENNIADSSNAPKFYDIIEKIVVGVCSAEQLNEIVIAYQQAKELPLSKKALVKLADNRLGLINPSRWK